jgi:D-glycero-alpha-D-manno-heptose-7-phosphate kinase
VIITRTPFRISFFGGGTDYPAYYREHGGAVLSTTINRYCYITTRFLPPFFDHRYCIRYSRREDVSAIDEIRHPSVRECLRFMQIDEGIEVVHTSDIPAMSGVGSSSAFTVGLLNSLYALTGRMATKRQLATEAIHVEQNLIGENVGSQDQTAAAFGGLNRIDFTDDAGPLVTPLTISAEAIKHLQEHLLFFFTGFSRISSDVAAAQVAATPTKLAELATLKQMVDRGVELLCGGLQGYHDFGELLHEAWMLKRTITDKITDGNIDAIYEAGRKAGAVGGKLCGAGGGGFMLFFAAPERHAAVKEALRDLLLVPIRFDTLGSHVAFYSQ